MDSRFRGNDSQMSKVTCQMSRVNCQFVPEVGFEPTSQEGTRL